MIPVMEHDPQHRCHACAVCDRACDCARGWRYLDAHPNNYQQSQVSGLKWELLVPAGACDCPHIDWWMPRETDRGL